MSLTVLVGNVQKIRICGNGVAELEQVVVIADACNGVALSGVCSDTASLRDGTLEVTCGAHKLRCDTETEDGAVLTHVRVVGRVHCTVLASVRLSSVMASVIAMDHAEVTLHGRFYTRTLHAYVINAGKLSFLGTARCENGVLHLNRFGHIVGVWCRGCPVPVIGTATIRLQGP